MNPRRVCYRCLGMARQVAFPNRNTRGVYRGGCCISELDAGFGSCHVDPSYFASPLVLFCSCLLRWCPYESRYRDTHIPLSNHCYFESQLHHRIVSCMSRTIQPTRYRCLVVTGSIANILILSRESTQHRLVHACEHDPNSFHVRLQPSMPPGAHHHEVRNTTSPPVLRLRER